MKLTPSAAWRLRARAQPTTRSHSTRPAVATPSPGEARLRFAPSPTGYLHLGGLRTALFNHLLARKWGGRWILRIEDTDRTRLVDGSVDALRNTLEWAGLDYDEGVGAGGSYGPYTQSERLDLYHHHIRHLLGHDKAYECFCTPDELLSIRVSLHQQGQRHTYDGRCRHLSEEERARRKKAGQKHVVRFKAETGSATIPPDLIHGDVQFPAQALPDDVVLLKSDGYPTYHLASVVDDHEMRISHVLRGEEWLPSLPKHHALYRAFGWEPPHFAHLPLLVNADGTKLSKRTGDVRVDAYREKGYEPEALLNFLALMGWDHHSALATAAQSTIPSFPSSSSPSSPSSSSTTPPTENDTALPDLTRSDNHSYYDLFTLPQLTAAFSLDHVNLKKAAVNLSKLDFINKMTLRRKAGALGEDGVMVEYGKAEQAGAKGSDGTESLTGHDEERGRLVDRVQQALREDKLLRDNPLVEDREYVERVFEAELPRIVKLCDMTDLSKFFFLPLQFDNAESLNMVKTLNPVKYVSVIENVIAELQARLADSGPDTEVDIDLAWRAIHAVVREMGIKKSELLSPMRHALTARQKGPSVPAIMQVLGTQRSLYRLEQALEWMRRRIREGAARNAR